MSISSCDAKLPVLQVSPYPRLVLTVHRVMAHLAVDLEYDLRSGVQGDDQSGLFEPLIPRRRVFLQLGWARNGSDSNMLVTSPIVHGHGRSCSLEVNR